MRNSVKYTVTFGKDRYHQHIEMSEWCRKNLGFGTWLSGTPKTWDGLDRMNWSVASMFGNTTFAFRQERDYTLFVLKWS